MRYRLLILSDLWGEKNSALRRQCIDVLQKHLEKKYYDYCQLAKIDATNYTEENLHQLFLNGGISKAVENLCKLETKKVGILGFSVGGYIGWKAALMGLNASRIFAVSSTRLRKEFLKPDASVNLLFGENDNYKPTDDWFLKLSIKKT